MTSEAISLPRKRMRACPPWCGGHNPQHQPWQQSETGELERLHAHYRQPVDGVGLWPGVLVVETREGVAEAGVVFEATGPAGEVVSVRLTVAQAQDLAAHLIGMYQHAAAWNNERADGSRP